MMTINAISTEDLKAKGLDLLPNKIELTVRGDIFPDTYGELIGRYDKNTDKYESFFKKDVENGNTYYFDLYKEKCNLYELHRDIFNRKDCTEKSVIDYFVMYNIEESTMSKPTIISDHVDNSYCVNGSFKCEYELLFANDDCTRRIVVPFTSVNIPMYDFIKSLEDMIEDAVENNDNSDSLNILVPSYDNMYEFTMFDKIGSTIKIDIENISELMSMLVSIRLIGYEFIKNEN